MDNLTFLLQPPARAHYRCRHDGAALPLGPIGRKDAVGNASPSLIAMNGTPRAQRWLRRSLAMPLWYNMVLEAMSLVLRDDPHVIPPHEGLH